jgi:CheY-like chemotaxis protein
MTAAPDAPDAAAGTLAGWRLLVVDDNTDAAELLAELLAMDGAEVDTAFTGRQALDKAQAGAPYVVLLDLGLPDMNGLEVARMLSRPGGPRLVAVSGHALALTGAPDDPAGCFDAALCKPIDYDQLLAVLIALRGPDSPG